MISLNIIKIYSRDSSWQDKGKQSRESSYKVDLPEILKMLYIKTKTFFNRIQSFPKETSQDNNRVGYKMLPFTPLFYLFFSGSSRIYIYTFFLFLFFSITAGLQCSVNFLLYSRVTQSYVHRHILFSHIIMLHHKCLNIVPSRISLLIHYKGNSLHLLMPNSQSIPLPPLLPWQ